MLIMRLTLYARNYKDSLDKNDEEIRGLLEEHHHLPKAHQDDTSSVSKKAQPTTIFEPGHAKMCLMPYANNKGADQSAHPRSLGIRLA